MNSNYPNPKYFDYSSSWPPFPDSLEMFVRISRQYYANPSSMHSLGREAQATLRSLKREICDLVQFPEGRLLLCSSGTEANNTIIEGHLRESPRGKLLIAEDVHDCIWYATRKYPKSTQVLRINPSGQIDIEGLRGSISHGITMACVAHASNETGAIHPVATIADICSQRKVRLLIDGVQALGHIPVDMSKIPCDYYSFSAHKSGGPRSAGGVFIRDDDFEPLLHGGRQEWGIRAGTENIAGLSACLVALKKCQELLSTEMNRLSEIKRSFLEGIKGRMPGVLVNTPADGIPGFISLSFPGCSGHEIVAALSLSGLSISTGSACHANEVEPPRIIMALGRSRQEAKGTIRISMGYGNTQEAAEQLLAAITEYINIKT
jgi:cysteine desulfurase